MPIFEYECSKCSKRFEELVNYTTTVVVCPQCGSTETRKLLSTFAASTGNSSGGAPSCATPGCGSSGFG